MRFNGSALMNPSEEVEEEFDLEMLDNPSRQTWMILGGAAIVAAAGGLYWYMKSGADEEVVEVDPSATDTVAADTTTQQIQSPVQAPVSGTARLSDDRLSQQLSSGPSFGARNNRRARR